MRVSVTGMGLICPLGQEVDEARAAWREQRSALGEIEGSPVPWGARVEELDIRPLLKRRKDKRLLARPAQLALAAAHQALHSWEGDRRETGIFLGLGREPGDNGESNASLSAMQKQGRLDMPSLAQRGRDLYPPLLPLKSLPNMALAHIAIQQDLMGPTGTVTGGPEAGFHALWEGATAVAEGRAAAALVGAADCWNDALSIRDWARLGRSDAVSEAAVCLLLEPSGSDAALGEILLTPGDQAQPPPPHHALCGYTGAADWLLGWILSEQSAPLSLPPRRIVWIDRDG